VYDIPFPVWSDCAVRKINRTLQDTSTLFLVRIFVTPMVILETLLLADYSNILGFLWLMIIKIFRKYF
jgi:hypothetical protein